MAKKTALLVLVVLAIGTTAMMLFARSTEPREARDARVALAAGSYIDAAQAVAQWLRLVPDSPEAHVLKGRVALAMNALADAVYERKQAQALGYSRDDLALLDALIMSKAGRHVEAIPALFQAYSQARTPDCQLDEALAKGYLETYDLPRAMEILNRWARDFPDDPKPYLWRAEVHSRTVDDPRAVENDYREALRRDPSLARARLGLAEELRKSHKNAEAAREYDAFLALEPDDVTAHLGAGRNLMELGDEDAATVHLNRAMALDKQNAEPLKEMADAAGRRGDWPAALSFLDRAMRLDPYDVAVRHSRGLTLAHLGRLDEAKAEQTTVTRLKSELDRLHEARARLVASPNDRQSQLVIARWMFDHGHDNEGVRWGEKILAEQPDDAEANRLLADYHERRGASGLANFYRLHASPAGQPAGVLNEGNRP